MDAKGLKKKEWKAKITAILEKMHREDWMDDHDFHEFTEELVKQTGGWELVFKKIEAGVSRGYTPEQQFELINRFFEAK